jgi:transposase InsO family protein
MRHLIPVSGLTAAELADAFVARVYCLHGCPDNIVSDRGTQFISQFWTQLSLWLGITLKHSSSFHPETDGQTERINSSVEAYLRAFMNLLDIRVL